MKKFICSIGMIISLICFSVSGVAADTLDGYVAGDIASMSVDALNVQASNDLVNSTTDIGNDVVDLGFHFTSVDVTTFADSGGDGSYQTKNKKLNAKNIMCNVCHAYDQSRSG